METVSSQSVSISNINYRQDLCKLLPVRLVRVMSVNVCAYTAIGYGTQEHGALVTIVFLVCRWMRQQLPVVNLP